MSRLSIKTSDFLRKFLEAFGAGGSEKLFDNVNVRYGLSEPMRVLCVVATVDEMGWSSFLPARAFRRSWGCHIGSIAYFGLNCSCRVDMDAGLESGSFEQHSVT